MKIIHPMRRCPKCGQYNLEMSTSMTGLRRRYFLSCYTPGCWYFGPAARTKTGAIKKWNKDVESHGNA